MNSNNEKNYQHMINPMEFANPYQNLLRQLFNLTLTHANHTVSCANEKTKELLATKDPVIANQIILENVTNQIQQSTTYTSTAYQLISDAQNKVLAIFQEKLKNLADTATNQLKKNQVVSNPFTDMSESIMKSFIQSSNQVLSPENSKAKGNGASHL